jgi:hypothetical protein
MKDSSGGLWRSVGQRLECEGGEMEVESRHIG